MNASFDRLAPQQRRPAKRFEVIAGGRSWNSYDSAFDAESEASKLRSYGWRALVKDHRRPLRRPVPRQPDLFAEVR